MAQLKLIAEPWDVGPYGYQLGNFPPGWAEWNGQYRDSVRRFWKGDEDSSPRWRRGSPARPTSSAIAAGGPGPASISSPRMTASRCRIVVSYEQKHNQANGEDNRDGHEPNFSWNCGAEGPTDDSEIVALRDRQKRNFMATLLLSLGVPMIWPATSSATARAVTTTPIARTTRSPGWTGKISGRRTRRCASFVRLLIRLRRQHRVFSRPRFFRGEVVSEAGLKDITWVTPPGAEPTMDDWGNPVALSLGYVLCGAAGEFYTPGGQRDIDESFLVMLNAYYGDLDFQFPHLPVHLEWEALVDTAEPTGLAEGGRLWKPGEAYKLRGHSFALFINPRGRPEPAPSTR